MEECAGILIRTAFNNEDWAGPCKYPLKPRCWVCDSKVSHVGYKRQLNSKMVCDKDGLCAFEAGKDGEVTQNGKAYSFKRGQRIDTVVQVCAERTLCTGSLDYHERWWENFGRRFDLEKVKSLAEPDHPAFFVFREADTHPRIYTLWAKAWVAGHTDSGERLFFHQFPPFKKDKWVTGLTAQRMLGKEWGTLTYRYLNSSQVSYLNALILTMHP